MTIEIKILPVFQGDSILLFFNDRKNCIMIDSGTKRSYTKGLIKNELKQIEAIDLLVLTHTDEDHIGGILKYYEDSERMTGIIKNVWFNTGLHISNELDLKINDEHYIKINENDDLEVSVKQGMSLELLLKNDGIHFQKLIKSLDIYNLGFAKIIVLSPDKMDLKLFHKDWEIENENQLEVASASDYDQAITELIKLSFIEKGTLANKTSIALILETKSSKLLLLGDSYPSVIVNNLKILGYSEENKLKLNLVKVSHHGSNAATSPELLKMIDCTMFVISTNASNNLPTKECLARIVTHRKEKISLFFNYKNEITENIFFKDEFSEHNFEVIYLSSENNYTISVGE
ncbi:MAG TPA: MBL fold metallo-hydrolase [Prolixibacteraceae bacterium]|nr:MBL fold metallo-hydrolase [Prolixibacteraceae bacterium]